MYNLDNKILKGFAYFNSPWRPEDEAKFNASHGEDGYLQRTLLSKSWGFRCIL